MKKTNKREFNKVERMLFEHNMALCLPLLVKKGEHWTRKKFSFN